LTNLEQIRALPASKLAQVIYNGELAQTICMLQFGEHCNYWIYKNDVPPEKCINCIEKWLNSEAKKEKKMSPWAKLGIESPELLEALDAFEEVRKKLRKPFTDRGRALAYKKLLKLSSDIEMQIAIVEQSVERSWQGFFELKSAGSSAGSEKKNYFMNHPQRRYSKEELNNMGVDLLAECGDI